jgi:hypothetical protein
MKIQTNTSSLVYIFIWGCIIGFLIGAFLVKSNLILTK